MAYHLEGRLLEVCNCRVLCPCWIGEDPDFGTCDTIVSWHFDKGTQQEEAILGDYTGKLGGPVADLAKLVGEVVSVEKVPIQFDVQGGKGTLKVGNAGYAELEPYQGATGKTTTLLDTVFSTVPGAPVFVGKSPRYRSKNDKLGINLDMSGHNALQSTFVFDA